MFLHAIHLLLDWDGPRWEASQGRYSLSNWEKFLWPPPPNHPPNIVQIVYIYYHIFAWNKYLIPYQLAIILAPTDELVFH